MKGAECSGGRRKDEANGWFSPMGVMALIFLQCFNTVGLVTGRRTSGT